MKKFLIGCGITVLIVGVLFVGCTAYLMWKVQEFIGPIKETTDAYAQTNMDFPFQPPADGIMQPEEFERYLQVRTELMDSNVADVIASVTALKSISNQTEEDKPNPGKAISAMVELKDAFVKVGAAHAEILDKHEMSLDEYLWYSSTTQVTIMEGAEEGNRACLDLMKMMDGEGDQIGLSEEDVNDSLNDIETKLDTGSWNTDNAALIAKHKEQLANPPESLVADLVFSGLYILMKDVETEQAGGLQIKAEEN